MKAKVVEYPFLIQLNIEVDNFDAFENLRFIADEILEFSYRIDEYVQRNEGVFSLSSLQYFIRVVTYSETISEYDLFTKFSLNKELVSKAVNFIENIIRWSRNNRANVWQDEEGGHLGQEGAFALCVNDPKYIPLYTDYLIQSALEYEVHQYDHIEKIVSLYGLIPSTIRLLASRASLFGEGQYGPDQVNKHKENLQRSFKENPDYQKLFLDTAINLNYKYQAEPYFGGLQFYTVRFLSAFIQDELERHKWLKKIETDARTIFSRVDMS